MKGKNMTPEKQQHIQNLHEADQVWEEVRKSDHLEVVKRIANDGMIMMPRDGSVIIAMAALILLEVDIRDFNAKDVEDEKE
jgi:hypothetical protein